MLRAAYDAGIDPTTVDYVEAHGTGTISATQSAERSASGAGAMRIARPCWGRPRRTGTPRPRRAADEGPDGNAEGVLPPSLNYVGPNPHRLRRSAPEVVEDPRGGRVPGRPVAGVSGFTGGTNAHVVIAAPTEEELRDAAALNEERPLALLFRCRLGAAAGTDPAAADRLGGPRPRPLCCRSPDSTSCRASPVTCATGLPSMSPPIAGCRRGAAGRNHGRPWHRPRQRRWLTAERRRGQEGCHRSPRTPGCHRPGLGLLRFGSQHRKMGKELAGISSFAERPPRSTRSRSESGWSLVEKINDDEQNFDLESAQVAITVQIAPPTCRGFPGRVRPRSSASPWRSRRPWPGGLSLRTR